MIELLILLVGVLVGTAFAFVATVLFVALIFDDGENRM